MLQVHFLITLLWRVIAFLQPSRASHTIQIESKKSHYSYLLHVSHLHPHRYRHGFVHCGERPHSNLSSSNYILHTLFMSFLYFFSLITWQTYFVIPSLDPHEANLLVRAHPNKKGYPQIVLLDHGLYKGKWREGTHRHQYISSAEDWAMYCAIGVMWWLLYGTGMINEFHINAIEEIRTRQACTLILKIRCHVM